MVDKVSVHGNGKFFALLICICSLRNDRVFLLQGVATMAFAFLVWFLCPDYPRSERTGRWLTPREQKFVEYRLSSNAPVTSDAAFSGKESVETLKDPRLWAFMLTQVLMNTGGFGLSWFLVGEPSKLVIS